jgi:hypothetical protein
MADNAQPTPENATKRTLDSGRCPSDSRYKYKTEGLPNPIKTNELKINDIITYQVKKRPIYSKIIDITPTMFKVINFDIDIIGKHIYFFENNNINHVTKNYLSTTRKIFKIQNIIFL